MNGLISLVNIKESQQIGLGFAPLVTESLMVTLTKCGKQGGTMRDIRFRAWDVDKKECVYLVIGHHSINPIIAPSYKGNFDIWQQFTGLHDKNGKEIFEGDIVKTSREQHPIGKVKWSISGGWYFDDGKLHDYLSNFELEVIGNIYENKELLK